jgi:hypothetical protein
MIPFEPEDTSAEDEAIEERVYDIMHSDPEAVIDALIKLNLLDKVEYELSGLAAKQLELERQEAMDDHAISMHEDYYL